MQLQPAPLGGMPDPFGFTPPDDTAPSSGSAPSGGLERGGGWADSRESDGGRGKSASNGGVFPQTPNPEPRAIKLDPKTYKTLIRSGRGCSAMPRAFLSLDLH